MDLYHDIGVPAIYCFLRFVSLSLHSVLFYGHSHSIGYSIPLASYVDHRSPCDNMSRSVCTIHKLTSMSLPLAFSFCVPCVMFLVYPTILPQVQDYVISHQICLSDAHAHSPT